MGRGEAKALGQRLTERDGWAHIEAAADESQAKLFLRGRGNLDADAAVDALAGFVDDIRVLRLLDKLSSLGLVSRLSSIISPGVLPQQAGIRFATIAAQTAQ